MKPDNIMGNPLNPQSWNLYSYVGGNPVNFNDPTGHEGASPEQSIPRYGSGNLGINATPDLDDYLWGGASVSERGYYLLVNGKKQGGFLASPGQYGPIGLQMKLEAMLSTLGVPWDQVEDVAQQLVRAVTGLPYRSEAPIVIGQDAKGKVTVFVGAVIPDGYTPSDEIERLRQDVIQQGNKLLAWGHIHGPGWDTLPSGDVTRSDGTHAGDTYAVQQEGKIHSPGWWAKNCQRYIMLSTDFLFTFDGAKGAWNYAFLGPDPNQ